jgi:hypothetical protein
VQLLNSLKLLHNIVATIDLSEFINIQSLKLTLLKSNITLRLYVDNSDRQISRKRTQKGAV